MSNSAKHIPTAEHARILARDPGSRDELPWHQGTANCADGHAICSGPHVVARVLGAGYPIAEGWAPSSYANAAFIVCAVNSHHTLIAALEGLLDVIGINGIDDAERMMVENAEAVLTRVRESGS